jgi:alkylhydroperoxidase/carboxymuconolactone decarboxylase family protein YurZ
MDPTTELPSGAGEVADEYPELWRAFAALGEACATAGPVAGRELRLVKLALAIGAWSEGATHSHTRRALAEGVEPAALKQVALLSIPTLGLPRAVAALTWIEDITDPGKRGPRGG